MLKAPDFWTRSGPLSSLLLPLAWGHAALGAARRRLTAPWRAGVPVLCIGNLVAGGAGKTPVALSLARILAAAGERPQILSRGYGGTLAGPLRVNEGRHNAAQVGDEALLLARAAPSWIGRDRVASAKAAIAAGATILLLDDGLQNPTLHHDLSLAVIDAAYGFGNGRVIPAGPLREPASWGLARAHAIVRMGAGAVENACAGKTVLGARLVPRGGEDLKGRRLVAFAGIGRPQKFFATLRELGGVLRLTQAFADHHPYKEAELQLLAAAALAEDALLVTTEKDWVRLPPAWRARIRALAVEVAWDDTAALQAILARVKGRSGHG